MFALSFEFDQGNAMNSDNISQTLQKGFHVTLGATASLLEAIQDPQGSSQKFSTMGGDVNRLTEELEAKGVTTEQEARQFVDGLFQTMPNPFNGNTGGESTATVNTIATPVADVAGSSRTGLPDPRTGKKFV